MSGGVLFRSKADRAKREKTLRKSTLSFDADEEAEEPQKQQQPPLPIVPSSLSSPASLSSDAPLPSPPTPRVAASEADDFDGVHSLAALRAERQRRKEQSRGKASLQGPPPPRREVKSVTVGDDFEREGSGDGVVGGGGGGMYSKEGLAALRQNAIHIGAPSTSPPSSPVPNSTSSVPLDDSESSSLPPHESAQQQRLIRHARTQRARRRALADAGEDYIPLSTSLPLSNPSYDDGEVSIERVISRNPIVLDGASTSSRPFGAVAEVEGDDHPTLLREDDTDDVIDVTHDLREMEGEDRILFGDDGRQQRKEKRRKEIEETLSARPPPSDEPIDVEEEVDSEMEEWEMEQLKKGGVQVRDQRSVEPITLSHRNPRSEDHRIPNPSQPAISSLSYPALHSSLLSHLSTLRQVHAATMSHSTSLSSRLASLRTTRSAVQRKAEETEEAFVFYQEMSVWLQSLLAMLAEKVEDIDEAWEEMGRMRRRRGELKEERRRIFLDDEADEAMGKTAAEGSEEEVREVDEFGRDIEYVREGDRQRRDEVRKQVNILVQRERRRRKKVEDALRSFDKDSDVDLSLLDLDGWDSDEDLVDEVEGTAASHAASLASFHEDVRGLMTDVDEEWRDLSVVVGHFQHWKTRHPQSYRDAYIDLSLHKVFAPFIRIELMQIDLLPSLSIRPSLYNKDFTLGGFSWYNSIQSYIDTAVDAKVTVEPPTRLLSSLFDSVVCPWLISIVKDEWDVRSNRQGNRLSEICEELWHLSMTQRDDMQRVFTLHDSPVWRELGSAVLHRLTTEVEREARRRSLTSPIKTGERGNNESLRRWCVRQSKLLDVLSNWWNECFSLRVAFGRLVRMQAVTTIATAMPLLEKNEEQSGCVAVEDWQVLRLMLEVINRRIRFFSDPNRPIANRELLETADSAKSRDAVAVRVGLQKIQMELERDN